MTSTGTSDLAATTIDRKTKFRVLAGSLSGSTIEWFDFFLYATAAALVFDKLYFPTSDPFFSLMLSYLSLALTFFVRPIGGIVFSHIGDRVGRKKTLVITISMMGIATVAIGLVPTYAMIGVWAPILLIALRILQGIAIGGEWGGALLLAYEYAPRNRRGFFGSIPQTGVTIGLLLATGALSLMSQLSDSQFLAWGWRVPFIASIVLVVIGLWIRAKLDETPDFRESQKQGKIVRIPLAETLRGHWRAVLVAIGAKVVDTAPFYIFATFGVSYATETLGHSEASALNAVTVGAVAATVMIPLMGRLSDATGRRRLFVIGATATAIMTVPYFLLLQVDTWWAPSLATFLVLGATWPAVTATLGPMTSEIFSTQVRYTGITLGYQIGAALAGGTAPLLATYLLSQFDGQWTPIAAYVVLVALISIAAVALAGRAVRGGIGLAATGSPSATNETPHVAELAVQEGER